MGMYREDYCPDPFDCEYDEYTTSCKFCGEGGLTWGHDGRKWYLVDSECNAHVCNPKKVAKVRQKEAAFDFK